ncbi:MAG: hypothetical protein QHH80_13160, partial [Anaerolineae bacterium]|nr:hypothetical protein [Anaerolineae bacterium]
PSEADDLRKAIGKKIKARLEQLEPKFRAGAAATGTDGKIREFPVRIINTEDIEVPAFIRNAMNKGPKQN